MNEKCIKISMKMAERWFIINNYKRIKYKIMRIGKY
jgi:hypothetical protein